MDKILATFLWDVHIQKDTEDNRIREEKTLECIKMAEMNRVPGIRNLDLFNYRGPPLKETLLDTSIS
jgi:hypothetical protein